MNNSKVLNVRLTPENKAILEAMAKDAGVNRSEMLRRILEDVVKVGKVESSTGTITWNKEGRHEIRKSGSNEWLPVKTSGVRIVQDDGECVDVTPEELAARE
jgi:hypothetical protein